MDRPHAEPLTAHVWKLNKGTLGTTWLFSITALENHHHFPNRCSRNPPPLPTLFWARGIMLSEMTPRAGINYFFTLPTRPVWIVFKSSDNQKESWNGKCDSVFIPVFFSLLYRGADKSVARPGTKQANVSVRMARCIFLLAVFFLTLDAELLAISQYSDDHATGHLDKGFLGFRVPKSKCWDGSQNSKLPLHASHVALPT